jgi:hypothetical protein
MVPRLAPLQITELLDTKQFAKQAIVENDPEADVRRLIEVICLSVAESGFRSDDRRDHPADLHPQIKAVYANWGLQSAYDPLLVEKIADPQLHVRLDVSEEQALCGARTGFWTLRRGSLDGSPKACDECLAKVRKLPADHPARQAAERDKDEGLVDEATEREIRDGSIEALRLSLAMQARGGGNLTKMRLVESIDRILITKLAERASREIDGERFLSILTDSPPPLPGNPLRHPLGAVKRAIEDAYGPLASAPLPTPNAIYKLLASSDVDWNDETRGRVWLVVEAIAAHYPAAIVPLIDQEEADPTNTITWIIRQWRERHANLLKQELALDGRDSAPFFSADR